jgi:hypothetical protein
MIKRTRTAADLRLPAMQITPQKSLILRKLVNAVGVCFGPEITSLDLETMHTRLGPGNGDFPDGIPVALHWRADLRCTRQVSHFSIDRWHEFSLSPCRPCCHRRERSRSNRSGHLAVCETRVDRRDESNADRLQG